MDELYFFQSKNDGLIHAHGPDKEYQYTISWDPSAHAWSAFSGNSGICWGDLEMCLDFCQKDARKPKENRCDPT